MRAVVDTEAHGDDEVDAGHRVYGQAPEVHETPHLRQGHDDHQQHQDGASSLANRGQCYKTFLCSITCKMEYTRSTWSTPRWRMDTRMEEYTRMEYTRYKLTCFTS